jgi:L,D-transpeptidase catalytic domain
MALVYGSLLALEFNVLAYSRRALFKFALAGAAYASMNALPVFARAAGAGVQMAPGLLKRALDALEAQRDSIPYRDVLGIADFALPSRAPRFHIVRLADGSVRSHLVAHGRGSDPDHTGWLERFSNEPRSNATSAGAYKTGAMYVGAHGHSMRLEGLDSTNSNALSRAIVVHGAWYVSQEMIGGLGMLGRSEGCFAVANSSLQEIMTALGPGHLIYADRA